MLSSPSILPWLCFAFIFPLVGVTFSIFSPRRSFSFIPSALLINKTPRTTPSLPFDCDLILNAFHRSKEMHSKKDEWRKLGGENVCAIHFKLVRGTTNLPSISVIRLMTTILLRSWWRHECRMWMRIENVMRVNGRQQTGRWKPVAGEKRLPVQIRSGFSFVTDLPWKCRV